MKIIVISGPPGSGKTTIVEKLILSLGKFVKSFVLGEFISLELKRKESVLKTHYKQGKIKSISPKVLIPVVIQHFNSLKEDGCQILFYVKGPWSIDLAQELHEKVKFERYIFLDAKDITLIERTKYRRIDPKTGITYNVKYNQPESKDIQKRLKQKFGDEPFLFRGRLKRYKNSMELVHKFYKEHNIFFRFDTDDKPLNKTFKEIECIVKKHL